MTLIKFSLLLRSSLFIVAVRMYYIIDHDRDVLNDDDDDEKQKKERKK